MGWHAFERNADPPSSEAGKKINDSPVGFIREIVGKRL